MVVVQGTLTEASEAAADCLVVALGECTDRARPAILELLVQLASGYGEARPERAARIVGSLHGLVPTLEELFQHGSNEERLHASDLLVLCAEADAAVRSRVIDLAHRVASDRDRGRSARRLLDFLGAG